MEIQKTLRASDEVRREVRDYISSLDQPTCVFPRYIRQRWGTENSRRWVHNIAFIERHDQTYIGHAAKNLGALRRIVIILLKIDLCVSCSPHKKRRRARPDFTYRDFCPP